MTTTRLLPAALIAATMLTTPALARTGYAPSHHFARESGANAPATGHADGRGGIAAPRIGAFAAAPPDGGDCDVGDDPHIC